MINRKYQKVLFAFLMALMMSGIMSLVISIFNLGFHANIVGIWLKAWGFAFVVAFPSIMLVAPLVQRLVNALVEP